MNIINRFFFNSDKFIATALKYNQKTAAYTNSSTGWLEQTVRAALKQDFQNCSSDTAQILAKINSEPEILPELKNRVKYEWIKKFEGGMEKRAENRTLALDTFVDHAQTYNIFLKIAQDTPSYKAWRSSLKAYKAAIQNSGQTPEKLLEILKTRNITDGPAVSKVSYWAKKSLI